MGREVRRVPADWQHPKNDSGNFIPLRGGSFALRDAEWMEGWRQWQLGFRESWTDGEKWVPVDPEDKHLRFTEYDGPRPSPDDFMPDWPAEQRTHLMMYEDTSEGTPISPAFEAPEELARWLADNEASAFAGMTATYEQWLATINRGSAVSMVLDRGEMKSGVEAMA